MTAAALPPFSALLDAYGAELLAHARRLGGPADAEDLLQEALLRALRAYPSLRHREHLRAWLYRVVTTTVIDAHRARGPEVPVDQLPGDAAARDELPGDGGGFDALISPLPKASREVLHLRFVEDLDHDAIARRLGCSPAAARQRVSTAIRVLRKELAP